MLREIRRPSFLLIFLGLTGLNLFFIVSRPRDWVGAWPETGVTAQVPAIYLAALAAAWMAWMAGVERRASIDELLAPSVRTYVHRQAVRFSSRLVAVIATYLVGVFAVALPTSVSAPPGLHLAVGYFLLGLLPILLAAASGWAVGVFLSPKFASPVAGVGSLVFFSFVGTSTLSLISGGPEVTISLEAVSVWLAGAVLTCITAITLQVQALKTVTMLPSVQGRVTLGLSGLCAILAAAAFISASALGPMQQNRQAVAFRCVGFAPEACYWEEHQKYRGLLESVISRVELLPSGMTIGASTVWEYGLRYRQPDVSSGFVKLTPDEFAATTFSIIEGSKWSVASEVATMVSYPSFSASCNRTVREALLIDLGLRSWIETTLAGGGRPDYAVSGDPEILASRRQGAEIANKGWDRTDQHSWVAKQIAEYAQVCNTVK